MYELIYKYFKLPFCKPLLSVEILFCPLVNQRAETKLATKNFYFKAKGMNLGEQGSLLETVQDFLIKLDIKPLMHLLKISIFSLNNDIVRLTKIMNNLCKDCKLRTFKVIFQCLKLVKSFQKKNSVKNI